MSVEAAAQAAEPRAPRGERNDGRRGRAEREPRPTEADAEASSTAAPAFVDTVPGAQAGADDANGERDGPRRRRRRGGRGRNRDESGTETTASSPRDDDGQASELPPQAVEHVPAADAEQRVEPLVQETQGSHGEQGQPHQPLTTAAATEPEFAAATTADRAAPTAPPAEPRVPAPAIEVVTAAMAAPTYALPTQSLAAIASEAGLQWVNSDAEKIRAVQEAMASEPASIRTPRQPKSVAALDDGPLELVETKRDLAQIKLPFEHQAPRQSDV